MRKFAVIIGAISTIFLVSCSSQPTAEEQINTAVAQTLSAQTTEPVVPSLTPLPTNTVGPTRTRRPTNTPQATKTRIPTLTPRPTSTPTPDPEPIVLTGRGDDIVDFEKWDNAPAVLNIKHTGNSNFAIISYDTNGQRLGLLVNTIGTYSGKRLIDMEDDQDSARFEIHADGEWEILIQPLNMIRTEKIPGIITGNGDDAIYLYGDEPPEILDVDASNSDTNFVIRAWGHGRDLLVNEIAPYTGKVLIDRDMVMKFTNDYVVILEILAEDNWTISVNP